MIKGKRHDIIMGSGIADSSSTYILCYFLVTTLVESPLRQIEDAGGNTLKDNNIYDGENIIQIQ